MSITIDAVRPTGTKILVRRYEKPERTLGGIIIPEAWRGANCDGIWEFVRAAPGAARILGYELDESRNYLLFTRDLQGVHLGRIGDVDYWMLEAKQVQSVREWT